MVYTTETTNVEADDELAKRFKKAMERILIDTDVFIEVLLGRKRADERAAPLDDVPSGEAEGVVTRFNTSSPRSWEPRPSELRQGL